MRQCTLLCVGTYVQTPIQLWLSHSLRPHCSEGDSGAANRRVLRDSLPPDEPLRSIIAHSIAAGQRGDAMLSSGRGKGRSVVLGTAAEGFRALPLPEIK